MERKLFCCCRASSGFRKRSPRAARLSGRVTRHSAIHRREECLSHPGWKKASQFWKRVPRLDPSETDSRAQRLPWPRRTESGLFRAWCGREVFHLLRELTDRGPPGNVCVRIVQRATARGTCPSGSACRSSLGVHKFEDVIRLLSESGHEDELADPRKLTPISSHQESVPRMLHGESEKWEVE